MDEQSELVELPIISLWMPWANWVALGWKSIETRLHRRFIGLVGKRIGIHASQRWDDSALTEAHNYLKSEQREQTLRFQKIGGAIIATALVINFRKLTAEDSQDALIDCGNMKRFGISLRDVQIIEAIPTKGRQGIWYAKVPKNEKVNNGK